MFELPYRRLSKLYESVLQPAEGMQLLSLQAEIGRADHLLCRLQADAPKRVVLAVATYGMGEELKRAYPDLEDEDIRQALEYAALNLEDRVEELVAPQ